MEHGKYCEICDIIETYGKHFHLAAWFDDNWLASGKQLNSPAGQALTWWSMTHLNHDCPRPAARPGTITSTVYSVGANVTVAVSCTVCAVARRRSRSSWMYSMVYVTSLLVNEAWSALRPGNWQPLRPGRPRRARAQAAPVPLPVPLLKPPDQWY